MKLYKINELLLSKIPLGRVSLDSHEEIQTIYPGKLKIYDYPVSKNRYGKGIIPKRLGNNSKDFEYLIVEKKHKAKPNGNYYTAKNADAFIGLGYASPLWNLIGVVQANKDCEIFDIDNSSIKIEEGLYFSFIVNKKPLRASNMF